MTNSGYSDRPRVHRFAGFVGWLLLLTVLAPFLGSKIPGLDDREGDPDANGLAFAEAGREDHDSPVWSLAFSLDHTQLASGTISGEVFIKDLRSGKRRRIHRGLTSSVQSLAFSGEGQALAVAGFGMAVRFFDTVSGAEFPVLPIFGLNEATHVAISPDGKYLATSGVSGITTLWEWSGRRRIADLIGGGGSINSLVFSPDGSTLAAGHSSGLVKLWDVATAEERTTLRAAQPGNGMTALAFSPDGKLLATASFLECSVRLWNVDNGTRRAEFPRMAVGVRGLAFSPDGTLLAMALWDGTAQLWGMKQARVLSSVRANDRGLQSIAFSPDGRLLATGGNDGYVHLWNVDEALKNGSIAGTPKVAS